MKRAPGEEASRTFHATRLADPAVESFLRPFPKLSVLGMQFCNVKSGAKREARPAEWEAHSIADGKVRNAQREVVIAQCWARGPKRKPPSIA